MKKILSLALALMLLLSLSLSAFASEFPYSDLVYDSTGEEYTISEYADYIDAKGVIILDFGNYQEIFFYKSELYADSAGHVFCRTAGVADGVHAFNNFGSGWSFRAKWTTDTNSQAAPDKIVWSAYDIKNSAGNVVISGSNFPIPLLAEQVQGVTDQAMLEEAMKMTKTMGLLTVSGIGLMALLIGLALFGKRSLISLR